MKSAYDFEMADAAHAKQWRPDDPKADPTKAIDLTKVPVSRNTNARKRL